MLLRRLNFSCAVETRQTPAESDYLAACLSRQNTFTYNALLIHFKRNWSYQVHVFPVAYLYFFLILQFLRTIIMRSRYFGTKGRPQSNLTNADIVGNKTKQFNVNLKITS